MPFLFTRLHVAAAALAGLVGTSTVVAQPAPDASDNTLAARADRRVFIVNAGRHGAGSAADAAPPFYVFGNDVEVRRVSGLVLMLCGEIRELELRTTGDPDARAEAAIRRLSEEFARGEPDYDLMAPCMARTVRADLGSLRQRFAALGPIKGMRFDASRSAKGVDAYEVEYAEGSLNWVIGLNSEGQTEVWMFVPVKD